MFSFSPLVKGPGKREHIHPLRHNPPNADRPGKRPRVHRFRKGDQTQMRPLDTWRQRTPMLSTPGDEAIGFVGTIKRGTKEEAISYAHRVLELQEAGSKDGPVYMTLFADASMGKPDPSCSYSTPGAYAVVYKDPKDGIWVEQAWFVEGMVSNHWGEGMAIAEALNMAALQLRQLRLKSPTAAAATDIHIFTDSMNCLDIMGCKVTPKSTLHNLGMTPVWLFIKRVSHELRDLGARLTLSFHPGHEHDVEGHAAADSAAFEAFLKGTGNLQLLESENRDESPAASNSTSPAQQGNDHDLEGHTGAHDAVDEPYTEGSLKLQLLESDNPTESPSAGLTFTSAAHRNNYVVYQSKKSQQHNAFWRVFHSLSAANIEAFRRQNQPTSAEEKMLRELRESLRNGPPHRKRSA